MPLTPKYTIRSCLLLTTVVAIVLAFMISRKTNVEMRIEDLMLHLLLEGDHVSVQLWDEDGFVKYVLDDVEVARKPAAGDGHVCLWLTGLQRLRLILSGDSEMLQLGFRKKVPQ